MHYYDFQMYQFEIDYSMNDIGDDHDFEYPSDVDDNGCRQFGMQPPYLYGYEEHDTNSFWTYWVLPGVGFETVFQHQRLTVLHERLPSDEDVRQHRRDLRRQRRERYRQRRERHIQRRRERQRRELQRELRFLQLDNIRFRRRQRVVRRASSLQRSCPMM